MQVIKRQLALLLGGIFLLTLPVVHAKKPDPDESSRERSSQGRQYREDARDSQTSPARAERRDNRYADERQGYDRRDEDRSRSSQPRYIYDPRNQSSRGNGGNDQPPPARGKSLSEAVNEAERRTGGQVLSADPRDENGERYYRVKVLTPNGRVQILYIDAR